MTLSVSEINKLVAENERLKSIGRNVVSMAISYLDPPPKSPKSKLKIFWDAIIMMEHATCEQCLAEQAEPIANTEA